MSTYRAPNIYTQPPHISDLGFFADIQFDPNDALPIYIGLNVTKGASDDALDWKVYKFTYSGINVTRVQLAYGTWTGRAALFV